MKNYEEIIELNDYFQPAYDIENETGGYWKQFIPNEKFYKVLSEMLNSLESNNPAERKSIWLQGTYGTGKSHATAVVKHLLCDDLDKIKDYVENFEEQIKYKIKNFRNVKRVFPVVLKGTSSITDNRTFALLIEKAVRNSLKKEGIIVSTKTDFEKMIAKLQSNEINWENIFEGTELQVYGTKKDIISKLQKEDISMLRKIENLLSRRGIHFSTENITEWLIEIKDKLKEQELADYLVIYWDEFTGVLELPKSGLLLTELQNIAELSASKGIYLFLVSHRRPNQTNISTEDIKKVHDRFKTLDYSMEQITTYHIINAAIKKKDKKTYESFRDKYVNQIDPLMANIAEGEYNSLKNLFPIHPYAAYLATFVARNIGSTERSIFNFLFDEQNGFNKFIKENPGINGRIFLTADYLWDFFYEEFERIENERVYVVLERFNLHKDVLEKKGFRYLSVFKGILLLNLLYRYVESGESSLIAPSERNIMNLFLGAIDERDVTSILQFLDDNQIINKTPDNLYLVTSSGLPLREIENEKDATKREYGTIDKILDNTQKRELKNLLSSSANRYLEIIILDASLNKFLIRKKIEKAFEKDYAIHVCLFLGKNKQEIYQIKSILKDLSMDNDLNHIIFVVSETILDDKTFNKFIEYKARAIVAGKHNYSDEKNTNEEYARKIIDGWISQVKSGFIEYFLQNEKGKEVMNQFSRKVNKELTLKIFPYGVENIERLQVNTIWREQKSTKALEIFLFSRNRNEIEEKTKNNPWKYLREIIKDSHGEYIVDINLKMKEDASENHPLKKMYLETRKIFEKEKDKGVFNIGDVLRFLTKPPYGVYANMLYMAAIGFLMREYVDKLFEVGTGMPIQKEDMKEKILDLFTYWREGIKSEKLDVRFGTEEERKLIEVLKDLFNFEDVSSLNDVRWQLRNWIKDQGFPIWVFKYAENSNENTKKALDCIFELIKSTDRDITYEKIKEFLSIIENVEYDLEVLIDPKDMKNLFEKWLKSIEKVKISDEEIEEVIDYIRRNMQEEVASWKEDEIREKVYIWHIEKQPEPKSPSPDPPEGGHSTPPKGEELSEEIKDKIKQKVERCSLEKIRDILIKLIEEHPEIAGAINKYLEES